MKLRSPMLQTPESSYFKDTIKLLHPKMLFIIMCLITIGTFTASEVDLKRYLLELLGVFFAVGLCAYRLNEIRDRNVSKLIPLRHHAFIAIAGLILGIYVGSYLAHIYGRVPLILMIITAILMILYNLSHNKIIHNFIVYGLLWGYIPVVYSHVLQTLNYPTGTAILFGLFGSFVAIQSLWMWGLRTCSKYEICRNIGRTECHSPILSCDDRLIIPGEVSWHMGSLINIQIMVIFMLTLGVVIL